MTTGDKIKKSVIYILLVLLAAACLFPGGACLLAAVAAALGRSFRHFGRGFGMGLEGIGQALAEAIFGCRGKHSPGYGRAEHQLGEE